MGFRYHAGGLKPQPIKDFSPVPDGRYLLKIKKVEAKLSKQGNDMVQVDCVIDDNPNYLGKMVRTYIVFMSPETPGAGKTLHFLKCIGEPHQGEVDVEPENWKGKSFYSVLRTKTHDGKQYNYCVTLEPGPDADPATFATGTPKLNVVSGKGDDYAPF